MVRSVQPDESEVGDIKSTYSPQRKTTIYVINADDDANGKVDDQQRPAVDNLIKEVKIHASNVKMSVLAPEEQLSVSQSLRRSVKQR